MTDAAVPVHDPLSAGGHVAEQPQSPRCDEQGCGHVIVATIYSRRDSALRLNMARKMRPMAIAMTATTIPPMIEAAAEAPVAKAMTR
jgi:hypothetical protein